MNKDKYLRTYFFVIQTRQGLSHAIRKSYSQFDNVMSVLAKGSYEINAAHLVKTYCLTCLLHSCMVVRTSFSTNQLNRK